ncbi:hypothetical protein MJO29_016635 [Puccinia striiformis f. sp. tritici]|uniref:Uncharacterized protein n=1 Tax=Puccinia striiformis f. sp. tritici PST-78 TaxID=1165861 RepID=A0A0L0UZV8_9BASI|nr:hypothetical protein MJO29_016635 [Puccinia striiformis f. sp. tritici]KNE92572.1 hypothetical protein PSTG_14006 [Puccinia striiformis f. sp. tritici PST-78]
MLNLSATQKAVLALFAIFLMSELDEEDLQPYYSDGGKATHVRFLLHEARPELFREATGLERPTFDALVKEVTSKGLLEDGRSVTVKEQILIFLEIIVHNESMREVALTFRRGLFTVQRYFHRFLEVLVTLYPKYVNLTPKEDVSERLSDPKYHSFKKCLGALDGVMIPITLPMSQQPAYRNRKGFIAQNVIAVCNFDLKFLYVLAGWEGSAHDSRVIADAFNKGLSIPEGQFYLADAGYALQKGLITPFRGVRYHLKEQATCSLKPANPKELFNLRHASLRNVVERIFGCLKSKFKILTTPSEHNIHSQVQLVYAITMLWNFLRHHDQYEEIPDLEEREDSDEEIDEDRSPNAPGKRFRRSRAEDAAQVSKQNRMSEKMWNQYQQHCSQR